MTKAELQLTEGAISNLQGQLLATAAGKLATELIWSTGAVKGGAYLLNGLVTTDFTQADVDAGLMSFRHDGGLIATLPKLSLSAGGEKTLSITPVFTVAPDNDAPILAPKVTTLGLGKSLVLSSSLLGVKDEETALADLQFTIKSSSHLLIKVAGIEQSTFSGLQLINKQVVITHDGSTSSPALRLGVSDGHLETSAWLPLRFSAANKLASVPVLAFSGLSVAEAAAVTLSRDLFTGTTGSDDAGLLVSVSSLKNGWFTLDGVKSTSFTLAEVDRGQVIFQHSGAEAAASFKLSLKSAQGKTAATAITVLTGFTEVADAPVISLVKPVAVGEGGTVKFGGNFKVTDGDTLAANLTYTVDEATAGQVELNGVKVTSFTAAVIKSILFRHDGSELAPSLKITVSDGHSSQSLSLPVLFTRVDEAPVISKAICPLQRDGTGVVVISMKDQILSTDPDGGDVTLKVKAVSGGFFAIDGLAVSSFTQSQVDAGLVKFILAAPIGATVRWILTPIHGMTGADVSFGGVITDSNQAPVASNLHLTIDEEGAYSGVISATDPEGGPVTFSKYRLTTDHGSYSLNSNTGAFTYTAKKDATGGDWFTVYAIDNKGRKTLVRVDVTIKNINDAPVIALPASVNIDEDGSATGSLKAYDVDLNIGSKLIYALAEAPLHGHAEVTELGSWIYTPDANWSGVDNFRALVRDPAGALGYATVVIKVAHVNDAPVWGAAHLDVVNGSSTLISLQDLVILDVDAVADSFKLGSLWLPFNSLINYGRDVLTFTVTLQEQGTLKLSGLAATSFTSEDLRANKVTFEHNGSGLAPALSLQVSDGTVTLNKSVSINFAQNSPAVTIELGEIHLERMTPLILTSAMISATDGVHSDAGITFYADIQNAKVEVRGIDDWLVSDHFTMADVNAGKVRLSSDSQLILHWFNPTKMETSNGYRGELEIVGQPKISIYASNGFTRSDEAEMSIKYIAPNHSPQLKTLNAWIDMEHRTEGLNTIAFVKLTSAMLSATDDEDNADNLRYSCRDARLYLDGSLVDTCTAPR